MDARDREDGRGRPAYQGLGKKMLITADIKTQDLRIRKWFAAFTVEQKLTAARAYRRHCRACENIGAKTDPAFLRELIDEIRRGIYEE